MKSGATGRSDVVVVASDAVEVVSTGEEVGGEPGVVVSLAEVEVVASSAVSTGSLPALPHAVTTTANANRAANRFSIAHKLEQLALSKHKPSFTRIRRSPRYTPPPVPETLYFAYTALLDPDRITAASPGATFRFTAHYPETRLEFVDTAQHGAVPTLVSESGHTVWGAVFEIPEGEVESLTDAEESEGRVAAWSDKAVDREGNKHDCLTFVAKESPNGARGPDGEYLDAMVRGARHWSLPAGWVLGLEDLGQDSLFA